jgi:hypothetical protein
MSELNAIGAVSPVTKTARVRPVSASRAGSPEAVALRQASGVAAATGGSLRPTTAQLVVDPDSQDVAIRISDTHTNQLISELAPPEVQAITSEMQRYIAAGIAAGKRS